MRNHLSLGGTVILLLSIASACAREKGDVASRSAERDAPADARTLAAASARPDTTAQALWRHLQESDYRDNWRLWPGTSPLYSGTEPHGMLLTTYANDVAQGALREGKVADLPDGSIVVKENYMPDSTFDAATVMYKVEGYNPDHQDWLFAKYAPDGAVDAFGRAPMCQACHQAAPSGYIYTAVEDR